MKKKTWAFISCVLILMTMLLLILPACSNETPTTSTAGSTATTTAATTETKTYASGGTIKISYSCPKNKGYSVGEEWFTEEFPKRTDGRWKVEAYGMSTLVPITAVLDSVRSGVCQIGLTSTSQFPKDFPLCMLTQTMSLGWPSSVDTEGHWYDAAIPAWTEYAQIPEVAAEINNGFTFGWNDLLNTSMIISKKKEIHLPSDFKGLKVGASSGLTELVTSSGGATVAIVTPELYQNLEKGVVDAASASAIMVCDWKLYNLCDYYFGLETGNGNMLVLYNNDFYHSLSPADKKLFDDTRAEAWPICKDFMVKSDIEANQTLKEQGKTITTPTAAEQAAWKQAVQDYWLPKWREDARSLGISDALLDKVYNAWIEIRAKYWKQYNIPGEP
jgi:TRAP-type C4-dicarboxylate transport system substrate-binding protein